MADLLTRLMNGRAPNAAPDSLTEEASKKRGGASRENRYITGRREFADQFAHLARGKRNWQIAAFLALGLLAVVTLAYIRLASTSRITPYIVEVDELGQARAFGPAEQLAPADARLIRSQLSLFVRNIRTVYPGGAAQKDLIGRAYAFVDASAQEWLNGYFRSGENDPRLLGRRLTRRVEVKSIVRLPESESWKVSWIEIETPHGTDVQQRTAWEGYLTVRQVPPTSASTIEYNPLGLYITAINWTQVSLAS